jgi:hypothetical protein
MRLSFVSLTLVEERDSNDLWSHLRTIFWISRAGMAVFDRFLICVAEACEIGDEYKVSIKLYMCSIVPLPYLLDATSR